MIFKLKILKVGIFILLLVPFFIEKEIKEVAINEPIIKTKRVPIDKEIWINDEEEQSIKTIEVKQQFYPDWELIWQDEFMDQRIDDDKWNVVHEPPFKNNELQHYRPENLELINGHLVLVSKKELYKNFQYTSGAIHTKNKMHLKYGKIDVKARFPKGKGVFPAVWLLAVRTDYLPEIDIVEMIGDEPDKVWMVYHWYAETLKREYAYYEGQDFTEDFHLYSVEWDSRGIRWLVDNNSIYETTMAPHEPLYLYVNTAIGGNWPGSPNEMTPFPQHFEVEYIRVFKKSRSDFQGFGY